MIVLQGTNYELVENYRDGFQQEAVEERYSDILKKYDFVVGDWGYDQLRLKGFYHDHHGKATFDRKISTLEDYLYEYCNFGCSYFVLQKVTV
ncbi:MAG TPA: YutD family protein [Bacillota bacterium]|nr:YutD family protein [Bacillota bacterium]